MNLFHDVTLLLNSIFFGLSIFLALILWNQKTSYRLSNRMLSFLLTAIAITTFNTIIRLTYYAEAMSFYQEISNAALLTMGPSIFLFIKIRVDTKPSFWAKHYLPFLIYQTLLICNEIFTFQHVMDVVDNFAFLTFVIQWITYISISFLLLGNYQKQAKDSYSNIDIGEIQWIKIVLFLLLTTLIARIAVLIYSKLVEEILDVFGLNLTLFFAMITCYLGYKIFKSPESFVKIITYSNSKLSSDNLKINKEKIDTAMEQHLLFKNPKLTIVELAEACDLHSRVVSQTLNQELKQNFFDFVNQLRVGYLIKKLEEPESKNYTLQALMEDSGFNSPSVGYTAFKKVTGMTPAKYRKNLS